MALDPKVEMFLAQLPRQSFGNLTVDEARRADDEGAAILQTLSPAPAMQTTEDFVVATSFGDVSVRHYRPRKVTLPHPIVFYHGGGFVLGSVATYHGLVSRLADTLSADVFSVDYTRAPEAKFPVPVRQCYEVTRQIARGSSTWGYYDARVVVAGDSAGGNFAASIARLAKQDDTFTISAALLFYPTVDMLGETESRQQFGQGYLLETEAMIWFGEHYLRDASDARDPLASPLLASDVSGLPPTLIATAEYDPLRDEGEAYGKRLREAGNDVEWIRYDGVVHGFLSVPLFDQAEDLLLRSRTFLTRVL